MQVAFGSFCFLINWLTGWSAGRENGGASRLAAVTACDQRSSSPYWARRRRQRQRSRESIQLRSATRCWLAQTLFIALDPTRLIQFGLYEQGLIFVLADTTGGERNLTNLTLQLNWDITAGRLGHRSTRLQQRTTAAFVLLTENFGCFERLLKAH